MIFRKVILHLEHLSYPFITFKQVQHAQKWLMPLHRHTNYHFIYIVSGKCVLTANKSITLDAGTVLLIPPGVSHGWQAVKNYAPQVLSIDLAADFFQGNSEFANLRPDDDIITAPCRYTEISSLNKKILQETLKPGLGEDALISAYLWENIILFMRCLFPGHFSLEKDSDQPLVIKKIIHYLEKNFYMDIDLIGIGNLAALSPNYICELFKKNHFKSPMKYLVNFRINHAKQLLSKSDNSVKEIALMCGYQDEHYFSKMFRKHTGTTPSLFRGKD